MLVAAAAWDGLAAEACLAVARFSRTPRTRGLMTTSTQTSFCEFGIGSRLSTGRSSPEYSRGMELGGWGIRLLA